VTTLYRWKLALLNTRRGAHAEQRVRGLVRGRLGRGPDVGNYARLPEYIGALAPGKSFADIGCMWGVNGHYAFLAEEAGATEVKGLDVFGPTPEFEAEHRARGSRVEFILGDATATETIRRVGEVDVVFCAGVLYHHPSPFDLLVALRLMCRETLILRTSTVPEVPGVRNMAVYWPLLSERQRRPWSHHRLGTGTQIGITTPFDADAGYGNWFWGLTPSCLAALLQTAGFRPVYRATEPWAQTFICEAVDRPIEHDLPDPDRARRWGTEVSAAGEARPQ
jgi:2-polyprenyl-3-methyl-5-hydroxy-6-metoxy-1,4-benzoquinol methylase